MNTRLGIVDCTAQMNWKHIPNYFLDNNSSHRLPDFCSICAVLTLSPGARLVYTFIGKISMIQRVHISCMCVNLVLFCFDDIAESIEWDILHLRFVVIAVGNVIPRNTLSFHSQIEFYFCDKITDASHPPTGDALRTCNWFLIHLWVWHFSMSFTQSTQNIWLGTY